MLYLKPELMEVIKLVSLSVCHVFLASQLHHVPFCQKLTRPFFVQGLWKPLVSAIITGYKTLSSEGGYVGTLGPLGVVLPVILLCVCAFVLEMIPSIEPSWSLYWCLWSQSNWKNLFPPGARKAAESSWSFLSATSGNHSLCLGMLFFITNIELEFP